MRKALYIILILAVVLRLAYIFVFDAPLNWRDCETFHIGAINIVQGQGYTIDPHNPFIAREPGYSLFFLAPIYAVFGHNVFIAQIFQIILCILIILMMFYICKTWFSENIGLIAGLFFAIYPPLVAFSAELVAATFFGFLVLLAVFIILKYSFSLKLCFVGGIILGMAVLTKSIVTFLPIFLIPFLYMVNRRGWWKHFLLICIAMILVITPYVIRNYVHFGEFVYGRDDGGLNLWAGSYIPWDGEFRGNDAYPLPDLIKDMDSFEADKMLKNMAIENILSNPIKVLSIWLKKPSRMLLKPEFESVLERENNLAKFSQSGLLNPDLLKILFIIINVIILVLAFIGAFKIGNKPAGALMLLIPAYFLILLLPFSPDVRYKLPIMPFLMILDGAGLMYLWHKIKR